MAEEISRSPLSDEGINHFTKLGLEKNPKLRVLVQASWPPRDGKCGEFKNEMRNAVKVEEVDKMGDSHNSSFIKNLGVQVRDLNASAWATKRSSSAGQRRCLRAPQAHRGRQSPGPDAEIGRAHV